VFYGYNLDENSPLDRAIEAAKTAATTQTQANIEAAKILADAHKSEVAEIINARADGELRENALKLSSVITIMITASQIYFSYIGKKLDIPDFIWVIVLSPWVGIGSAKLIQLVSQFLTKNK
jgi:hypothetical protein